MLCLATTLMPFTPFRCETEAMSSNDVSYCVIPSNVGDLLVAATADGLVRVAFAGENFAIVLAELSQRVGPVSERRTALLDEAVAQLASYFAGSRTEFDLALDLRLVSDFRRRVLTQLPHIPWGSTQTYAQIAIIVDSPQAVRAVGSACANNPLPLVLPCHRVVRSDGKPGGYLGGPEAKAFLLGLESA